MISLLELPNNVISSIVEHLIPQDVFNLSAVNKEFHNFFTSDLIWRDVFKQHWVNQINYVEFEHVESKFYEFVIQQQRIDRELEELLQKISHYKDKTAILLEADEFLKELGSKEKVYCVPNLKKLILNLDNLPVRYFAFKILEALRHDHFFRWIDKYRENMFEKSNFKIYEPLMEEFYFRASYLDPAFETLAPIRDQVLKDLVRKVKTHPKYDKTNPTNTVVLIRKLFYEVVDFTLYVKRRCIEDFSILRLYAGEASGTLQMNMAIVQRVASELGIKSIVTNKFIIVDDKAFDGGKSVIRLRIHRGIEVNSIAKIEAKIDGVWLKKLDLKPLECKESLVKLFPEGGFFEMRYTEPMQISNMQKFLEETRDSLRQSNPIIPEESMYAQDESFGINTIEGEDIDSIEHIPDDFYYLFYHDLKICDAYPKSQMPYDGRYAYIGGYYLMFQNNLDEYSYGFFENRRDELIFTFFKSLSAVSPFSYSFTKNSKIYKFKRPSEVISRASCEILKEKLYKYSSSYSVEGWDSDIKGPFDVENSAVGDLVTFDDMRLAIVTQKIEHKPWKCSLFTGNTHFRLSGQLRETRKQTIITEKGLNTLFRDPGIGQYFEKYDEEKKRFILIERV